MRNRKGEIIFTGQAFYIQVKRHPDQNFMTIDPDVAIVNIEHLERAWPRSVSVSLVTCFGVEVLSFGDSRVDELRTFCRNSKIPFKG